MTRNARPAVRLAALLAGLSLGAGCSSPAPPVAPVISAAATPASTPTPTATPPPNPPTAATGQPTAPAPTHEPTPRSPLAGRTIVVDPGHSGVYTKALRRQVPAGNGRTKPCNSSGTASNRGWPEHAFTWDTANRLKAVLQKLGATVVLTRPNDHGSGPCVNVRAAITNRAKADLLVSIHADGSFGRGDRGFHVIVSTTMAGGARVEAASLAFAKIVRRELETTGMPRSTYIGRGTALSPRRDIAGLNLSQRVGVMAELGNMRSSADLRLLSSPRWRQAAAEALARAVVGTLAPR